MTPLAVLAALSFAQPAGAESLREYYQLVRQSDPRLGIATASIEVAAAQRRQALGEMLPRVTAQAGLNETKRRNLSGPFVGTDTFDTSRYALNIDQPLLNMPKYKALQGADDLVRQVEFDAQDRQSRVRLDVIERYLGALATVETLQLAREEEQNAQRQLERVRALQARQLAKITDVLTMEARADLLRADRLKAEGELKIAWDLLAELVMKPVDSLLSLDPTRRLPPVDGSIELWEGQGVDTAPVVQAKAAAVERAQTEIERRQWLRAPVLTLQVSGQESDVGYDNALSPNTRTGVLSVNITVPLYSGGEVSAAIGEARGQARIAALDLEAARRTQRSATRSMYYQLESLSAQMSAAARAIDSTQRSLEAAGRGFELGVITISEYLDARRDALVARRDAMLARLEYLQQWATLHHLAGTLDEAVVAHISDLLTVGVAPGT